MAEYTAGRVGHEYWAVVTPHGATEEILNCPGAEGYIRAIVAERNAELEAEINPPIHRETERLRHGDLLIVSERRSDGTMVVRIDPGKEKLEVHTYSQGGVIR